MARIEQSGGVLIAPHGVDVMMGLAGFAGQKYLNLETFKRSGQGVKTPVWFAADPSAKLDSNNAKLYVYTIGASGKVKRIRNNPRVNVAPCSASGKVKGACWWRARSGDKNFSATRRPRCTSSAIQTVPMPPEPRRSST